MAETRILVIKLGALGDFCHAIGPMQAIRAHHPEAGLILLTRPAYERLGSGTGLFDEVWVDAAPKPWNPYALLALRRRLRDGRFSRVYDLQTSDRTGLYFRLMGPGRRPEWSGIVAGCSHRHVYSSPHRMHQSERMSAQLRIAGIDRVAPPDLSFMQSDPARFGLPGDHVLLIPGSSRHRPEKRWPAASYAELGCRLVSAGAAPVLIGTAEDRDTIRVIVEQCPEAVDLAGQTDVFDIASLARSARACVGNDTGPLQLAALAGCRTIALFGSDGSPDKLAPRTPRTTVLTAQPLSSLPVDAVADALAV